MKIASGDYKGTATAELVKIGAGGYVTAGVQLADDGWKICGGDEVGCWVRGPNDTKWTPMVDDRLMPAAAIGINKTVSGASDGVSGTWACDICATDSSVGYFLLNGWIYKITNLNNPATRAVTRLTNKGPYPNSGSGNNNPYGPGRMRVDPMNPLVMACMTSDNKLVYTTDGGTTMTELTLTASSQRSYIDVDRTSVSGGSCTRWFRQIPGTGVQMSTTGPGGTYTTVSGSPTTVSCIHVDAQGQCWVAAYNVADGLYKWTSGSGVFTKISTATISGATGEWVATDPATSGGTQHIVYKTTSGLFQSFDGGTTWLGYWNGANLGPHFYVGATSIAWQGTYPVGGTKATVQLNPWPNASSGVFTRTGGSLWCATGIGVMEAPTQPTAATSSSANTFRFYERSEGIDMLKIVKIIYPSGGKPVYASWDRLAIKINDRTRYTNQPNGYNYGVLDGSGNPLVGSLNHCSGINTVPGHPEVIVASMWLNQQVHCVSYDYGDSYTKQLSHPDGFAIWGTICPADLNTAIWLPGANGRPAYCTNMANASPTFAAMTGSGCPFPTKWSALSGLTTSQLIFRSAADNDGLGASSVQKITVTVNAASGAGSLVDNSGAKTVTVTPPSGTTTATQLATYINANSTLITATPTGSGAGAFPTGGVTLAYETGFGFSPFDTGKDVIVNDANGNLYLWNYGPTNEPSYQGVWILPYGANPLTGWVHHTGTIGTTTAAGSKIAVVPNGTSIATEIYVQPYAFGTGGLYRSTNSGDSFTLVTNTSTISSIAIGPIPPGKTRPAIAFSGNYNGVQGVWCYFGTTPGTDTPIKLIGYPLNNPDWVIAMCFNPRAFDSTAADQTLLWGGWNSCGGFALTYNYSSTLS
jgi:hypothetical protein